MRRHFLFFSVLCFTFPVLTDAAAAPPRTGNEFAAIVNKVNDTTATRLRATRPAGS